MFAVGASVDVIDLHVAFARNSLRITERHFAIALTRRRSAALHRVYPRPVRSARVHARRFDCGALALGPRNDAGHDLMTKAWLAPRATRDPVQR